MPASILAEPKRQKQKLSIDPQNLHWRHSITQNFGKKILEKMGWRDGKGIGKNEQGITENVRLKPNYVKRGLGDNNETKPEAWIVHNDDFAAILENLNKEKSAKCTTKNADEEESFNAKGKKNSSPSKRYQVKRNTFVKHLSQCSDYEKAGIFGRKKAKLTQDKESESITNNSRKTCDLSSIKKDKTKQMKKEEKTIVSQLSIREYFVKQMQKKINASILTEETKEVR